MADNYPIPENPVFNPEIRKLLDSDPASASTVFNPLVERLLENILALKVMLDNKVGAGAMEIYLTDINNALTGINTALNGKAASNHGHNGATTQAAGFMSAADKSKLDGITAKATANNASTTTPKALGAASAGSESGYARGDHVHPKPGAADIGAAAANHNHTAATTGAAGFMSATDKSKLDGIAAGANKTTVDTALSSTSTNPVQNKVVNTALAGKAASSHNHDAGNITSGTLPIARGGTGATTAAAARDSLGIKYAPIAIGSFGSGPVSGGVVLGFKPSVVIVCGYNEGTPVGESNRIMIFFGTHGLNNGYFNANVTFNDNGFSLKTTQSYAVSYIALGTPF